jgi:murein DD-endopeptidase MepM/ murein hydrolase activator NlpD
LKKFNLILNRLKSNLLLSIVVSVALICLVAGSGLAQSQRTLQQGMEGRDVRELQETLMILGERLVIDGIFGSATKRAVIRFQKKADLPVDGVVGDETWDYLKEAKSFDNHKVSRGDTLSDLADLYGVSVQVIKEANGLDSNTIKIGEELVIPRVAIGGQLDTDFYEIIPYTVKRGDTLEKLASKYHTTISRIQKINKLETTRLRAGQKLEIPKLVLDLSGRSQYSGGSVDREFRWPVKGRISSGFGWRQHPITNERQFHGGIDVAVNTGTSVRAAKDGKVLTSGWVRGFGWTVTIDHGNGFVTLYAHNSKLLVSSGQLVDQGETVARSGNTGRSTGPHLDFRILINDRPVNPMEYLN